MFSITLAKSVPKMNTDRFFFFLNFKLFQISEFFFTNP